MSKDEWKTIKSILEKISTEGVSEDILRKLFIDNLNYDFADKETNIKFRDSVKNDVLSTKIIAEKGDFKIILCHIEALLKGKEISIVGDISSYYPNNLIIVTNRELSEAHFINTKYVGKEQNKKLKGFRRITVGKTDRLRTAAERLSMLYADTSSAITLMEKSIEAFDVEAVTEEFYNEFVRKYKNLRDVLQKNNNLSLEESDELTQNILNRLLFLYFIQKKGWLNGDYSFLYNNFKSNKWNNYYRDFLIPLFRKLSDRNFSAPGFENIPFLNGGLFEFHPKEAAVTIPNDVFSKIFEDLLERFNFTVREDTEYEEEVAIDPEMLGKIFEQLILSVETNKYKDIPDPRRETGSYYTPRFIVSFMVKQSLFNYLISEFPSIPKDKLKKLVFNLNVDGIDNAEEIRQKLLNLKIVDPGVGSGAFPVEILNRLVLIIETLDKQLGINEDRLALKKKLIEHCIYGVDIQDKAVNIARLRLWLSLIVDTDVNDVKDVPPLINLDFNIVKGDSLESNIYGFKFDSKILQQSNQEVIENYKKLKDKYAETSDNDSKKKIRKEIDNIKRDIAVWYLEGLKKKYKEELKKIIAETLFQKSDEEKRKEQKKKEDIEQEISNIDLKINEIKSSKPSLPFNWYLDFFEVMSIKGGFDIVIGNPPYGVEVDKKIYKDEFGLASSDSYGVFVALGLDILKPEGTLCYIMSDTWQTIKTHYNLRKKLYEETKAQYLISVPMKTFKATVNPGVYLFKRTTLDEDKDNFIIAADFHNLDIKKGDLEAAFDLIVNIEPDEKCGDGCTIISDKEMAIYAYRQKIIGKYSNLSYFIASPKLFKLMQDVGNLKPKVLTDEKGNPVMFNVEKQKNLFEQEGPDTYLVNFNGKTIELVKLGSIAEVKSGLSTSENDYYLRQMPGTSDSYQEIDLNLVLKEDELEKIRNDEKLRMDVIENGICTNPAHKEHQHRYFGGRYFVPYDKGGASDIEEGWLPNYYVPTPYFIDWSEDALKRMKSLTIADIWQNKGKKIPVNKITIFKSTIAATFRNIDYYFKEGLTFSSRGMYAPTFRYNSGGIFHTNGACIFFDAKIDLNFILASINSKFNKYIAKNYIEHSVAFEVDKLKDIILSLGNKNLQEKLKEKTISIIQHQKQDPRYDYMTNEQVEIDKLVYELYNLNEEDIQEVENWYFRRYPKLARIIEAKLKGAKNGNK